jgi:hypothetical protein
MGERAEAVAQVSPAADLAERTARAVSYVMTKHCATDMATFIDELPMPDNDRDKADKLADATEVFIRSLSYAAAYSYGLCLLLLPDVVAAGKRFRDGDVQDEMRASAMRVARSVMEK